MIDSIGQIFKKEEIFNWSENMTDIICTNFKECQEVWKAIKFTSLLMWIAMEKYSPLKDLPFTIKKVPTMEK
jgi:hypothetical protein